MFSHVCHSLANILIQNIERQVSYETGILLVAGHTKAKNKNTLGMAKLPTMLEITTDSLILLLNTFIIH